jgi:minor extracellular serine protease Vpr
MEMGKLNLKKIFIKKTVTLAATSMLITSLLNPSLSAASTSPKGFDLVNSSMLNAQIPTVEMKTENAYISPSINTTSSDKINVIVELSGQPVSVRKFAAKQGASTFSTEISEQAVQSEQGLFINAASQKGITVKVNYKYSTVLNGMEITINANQIPQLAKIPGVKSIHQNVRYYPSDISETTTILPNTVSKPNDMVPLKQIGVDTAWSANLTGAGLKVGVIDTGVDYLHPDLKEAYKGGYDSIDLDDDPYELIPNFYAPHGSYHGTHVSGTIVGRGTNPTSAMVQKGIAYESDLYVYRVLGGNGGSSAQVIDGIEHAVKDHMDVINLSLGSDSEKDPNSPDSIALNNAVLGGVVAVVANGNAGDSGPYYYSMGSPAGTQLAISVAAATSDSTVTSNDSVTNSIYGNTIKDTLNLMSWKTGMKDFTDPSILGTAPLEAVYVGLGKSEDYLGKNVTGKIALISRGEIAFDEKMENALNRGAKAAIIFNGNTLKGESIPDLSEDIPQRNGPIGGLGFLGDHYTAIPTFDMRGDKGRALARHLLAEPNTSLFFTFAASYVDKAIAGDKIASFSSRGPNSDGNYSIKPDISAPGVGILSTWPVFQQIYPDLNFDQAYNRISGTSMAAPHITGLVLLLKQQHPDWSPMDIRAALANTADVLTNEDGTLYDVYSQGAGRVDVAKAIQTPALLESLDTVTIYDAHMKPLIMESEASSVSFGAIDPNILVSKPLQLKNTSFVNLTYTANIDMHAAVTSDPAHPIATPLSSDIELTLDDGNTKNLKTITVDPHDKHIFTLSAKAKAGAVNGVYEGQVTLTSSGHPTLHLPFVIHVGNDGSDNQFSFKDMAVSNPNIPDAGGSIEVSATLAEEGYQYVVLQIYAMDGRFIGQLADYKDYDDKEVYYNPLASGRVTFENIDGSYINGEVDEVGNYIVRRPEPGLYKLAMSAYHVDNESISADAINSAFRSVYVGGVPTPGCNDNCGVTPPGGVIIVPPIKPSSTNEALPQVIQPGQRSVSMKAESVVEGNKLTATVSNASLEQALAAAKGSPTAFVVSVTTDSQEAQLQLTAAQLKLMKAAPAGSSIVFSSNMASVAFPLSALESLLDNADIVLIIKKDESKKQDIIKQYPDASILGTPYSFEANTIVNGVTTPLVLPAKDRITRAFSLDKGIDTSSAGVLYTEDDGQVYAVPAQFTSTESGETIVTITRPGFSTYAVAVHDVTLPDIETSWAKTQIQSLVNRFILNGTSSTTFSPKSKLTRAQFSSMLVRALGLQMQVTSPPFSDVTSNDWFAQDVAAAYQAGLVNGIDDGFHPNAEISRQDMTVMLARALKLLNIAKATGVSVSKRYVDFAQFADYAKESIQSVTDAGLMDGYEMQGSTYFNASNTTTREEAAKVLYELIGAAKL